MTSETKNEGSWKCCSCHNTFTEESPSTTSGWPCFNKYCKSCTETECSKCVNCEQLRPKDGGITLKPGYVTYRDGEAYSLPAWVVQSGWHCYRCGQDRKTRKEGLWMRF